MPKLSRHTHWLIDFVFNVLERSVVAVRWPGAAIHGVYHAVRSVFLREIRAHSLQAMAGM